jgi:predicted polyphosphate/ATP-dependent NAD kinase
MNELYIESDLLEHVKKFSRGYDKAVSVRNLELLLDCSKEQIIEAVETLNLSGEPVFRIGVHVFYLGKENQNIEDLEALRTVKEENTKIYQLKQKCIDEVLRRYERMYDL